MQKFYKGFLRVSQTPKYSKITKELLPGSVNGASNQPRPLYQHRENPYIVNVVWGIILHDIFISITQCIVA